MPSLTEAQLEIIKILDKKISEPDLKELRKILAEFMAKKAIKGANDEWEQKKYSPQTIEEWKDEHMRVNNL